MFDGFNLVFRIIIQIVMVQSVGKWFLLRSCSIFFQLNFFAKRMCMMLQSFNLEYFRYILCLHWSYNSKSWYDLLQTSVLNKCDVIVFNSPPCSFASITPKTINYRLVWPYYSCPIKICIVFILLRKLQSELHVQLVRKDFFIFARPLRFTSRNALRTVSAVMSMLVYN